MLTAFPRPYPDELLYSVITRYHVRTSNSSPKWTLKELFGTDKVIPTFDLPSHLDRFSIIVSHLGISTDDWIDHHTLYPLYAPFLPEHRAVRLRKLMKEEDGSRIHAYAGITASLVERRDKLLYCPSCYTEDINRHGEPYWHRIHQVPGVFFCPFHKTALHKLLGPVADRHGLTILPIAKSMFTSTPLIESTSEEVAEKLCELANDIFLLIQTKALSSLYQSKQILLPQLHRQGYVTASSRIRQQPLADRFKEFYGKELLEILDSTFLENHQSSWLTFSTRKERRTIHPIRQILLIRFLYGSFETFATQLDKKYAPFGNAPWPCLNKAADHFREFTVQECQITRCSDTGRPVGTFYCDCGFVYSRRGPDVCMDDRNKRGRIKAFGNAWFEKLQSCLQEGLSYRAIARILGVDTNTVKKYAGHPSPHLGEISQKPRRNVKRKPETKADNPLSYRRVDWGKRDLQLSWYVEEECRKLLEECETKPIRICVRTIGNRIGRLAWLEKSKQKLPITMSILSKYIESDVQFQIRRVRWAARMMKDEWPLKRWKIEKVAGLSPGYEDEVLAEINRCIALTPVTEHLTSHGEGGIWVH
ncbi:TnsD family Tn7-like transposition protein [Brevibacillus invocatus]|uniref:TnsD family Tn7-like transposition protein n=1 Tax=Brevibacillus invocatus TaxID=173959 RepID=UPI00203D0112|nr:TnsD family Tn7-like transposition protein [Brevibacillus invocatus]MCM3081680.1 TnsD family transposase [Brevibacillus invocatus]MCM3432088.1 TnsD family transposase [Brevibacillus invocatus]